MINLRVTSEFWVAALRKKLESEAIPIFVVQKGDKQAGAIIIRVSDLRGRSKIFVESPSVAGDRQWMELSNGLDSDIDEVLQRQKKYDTDAWILEVEEAADTDLLNRFFLPN